MHDITDELRDVVKAVGENQITEHTLLAVLTDVYRHEPDSAEQSVRAARERDLVAEVHPGVLHVPDRSLLERVTDN